MVKVSVIIPVYNTERYLKQCLNSVLAQTLEEIEIICVDDGSTDSSLSILQSYAENDSRIRIIHKENGGLVSARKAGVKAAKGIYIGYVDSDDWIEPEMYERLYRYGVENQADLVCSGYFLEGNYTTVHLDNVAAGLYEETKIRDLREDVIFNLEKKDVGIRASLCCKLFSAEKLKKLQMEVSDEITISEDKMCLLSYLLESKRVYITKEVFYHYLIHPASMVHTPNPRYLEAVNAVYQYLIRLYDHPAFTKTMRMQAELYLVEMLYKGINSRLGFENRNLFWVDPYWLETVPEGSRVVLYGAGELGEVYRRQMGVRKDLTFAGFVDAAWERFAGEDEPVYPPERLPEMDYDVVIITIKNPPKAREIKNSLIRLGIPEGKLRWYEQKEIFWKYAEVNGWI